MSKSKSKKDKIDKKSIELETADEIYMKNVEKKDGTCKYKKSKDETDSANAIAIMFPKKYVKYTREEAEREEGKNITNEFFKKRAILRAKAFNSLKKYKFTEYCMHVPSSEKTFESCIFTISSISTAHADNTGGFMDSRLGPLNQNEICVTCYKDYRGCDGHKAWISFPVRIPNPMFERDYFNTIKCICWCCGAPFADRVFIESMKLNKFSDEKYREKLAEHSKKLHQVHSHGGYVHEEFYKFVEGRAYYHDKSGKKVESKIKHSTVIYEVFKNLNKEQREILGFYGETQPENYQLSGISVIPPRLRRPGFVNGLMTSSGFTDKFVSIYEQTLNYSKSSSDLDKKKYMAILYEKLKELFIGGKKKYNTKDKGIIEVLAKKNGRLRRYGMGKRPDGSSRAVVGSITGTEIDQFGIPKIACKKLFVPIKVHKYNIGKILKDIKGGLYMKATIIKDGVTRTIPIDNKPDFIPVLGNTVWRNLRNNDIILHGRQPTLHAESLMASRVKEVEGYTCRLASPVTGAMNCDFDGDENTWHVVFTTEALIELMTCSSVVMHVPNLESNKPMMAPAFHALLMAYEATEKWVYPSETGLVREEGEEEIKFIERMKKAMKTMEGKELEIPIRRFPEILSCIKHSHRTRTYIKRCEINGVNYLSGRALLSLAFPTNLTYKGNGLEIVDGILVKGVMKSGNIAKGQGSIVQIIYKLYSSNEAARFISDFSKITDWLTMYRRFSIGQQSFSTNRDEIKRTLNPQLNKIQAEIYALGPEPDNEFDKIHWKRALHSITDQNLVYAKNVGNAYFFPNNGLNMLSGNGSGGKGSDMNTSQITALLGLQKIKGDFQKKELNDGQRLLPTFLPGDCSLESFGFVCNSFYDGLNPSELFMHLCASREGLIATAVQVAEVGTVRRDIEKSTENNIVDYRGCIASKLGKIYSFTNPFSTPAMSVFVEHPQVGKVLSFCDFKTHADFVNGQYEYIRKYMNVEEENQNDEGESEEESEEDEIIERYELQTYENETQQAEVYMDEYDEEDNGGD